MDFDHNVRTAKWGEVKQIAHFDIAILPWGATEPHNGHLPYCTDVILSEEIALDAAKEAAKHGVMAMVLPGVPFGSQNPGQNDLPFCIHTSQSTQAAILNDIVSSLDHQGIKKLLIINGHGGNSFKGIIRDLAIQKPDFLIASSDWFSFVPRRDYFEAEVDDHAGEQETSVMMHYHPELVKMEYAGKGEAKSFTVSGLNEKVAWIPRNWAKITSDTGVGDPSSSSAAKGAAYLSAVIGKYVELLTDLSRKDLY